MAENKNQISTQEWSERMRRGSGSATSPLSISRAPANVSGPLAQLKSNLDSLAKQRYGLAMGNVTRQYNLADRLAQATAEISANAIARKDQLYANRQANIDRMSQMYGQYYQQFGNVLNKEALDFLDQHSDIKVPTLTAIMAGYEHARASRAEQALAALDRTAKITEAEAQLEEKRVALENEKSASDLLLKTQQTDAQSKANQAAYDAQKAYLDEQAKNEMLGAGLASTGRGTGVRALPGFGGGVGAGARAGVGRVPSAVTGARSGETVTGAAAPTGRVVQTADGQTVAVDNNKNVIGTVVPTQNGSVVVNDNGQTVGSVDANGNVIPTQQSLYAQYQAAGGGGFWEDPIENTVGSLTSPTAPAELVSAGYARRYANQFGYSSRAGYLDSVRRTGLEGARMLATDANMQTAEASRNFINAASQDPRYNGRNIGRYENYLQLRQNERIRRLTSGLPLGTYNTTPEELRAWNNLQFLRSAEANSDIANRNVANAVRSLGGQEAIDRASRAGRFMRGAGAVARTGARIGGRALPVVGQAMLAADVLSYAPAAAWALGQGAWQGAKNVASDMFGNRSNEVAAAIAEGRPVPPQLSAWQAMGQGWRDVRRQYGRIGINSGMANTEDVQNFERFYEQRTGQRLDFDTKVMFDKQNDVTRTAILDGLLSGKINGIETVNNFIKDTINTYSNPQEQRAIQQEIKAENDQAVFDQSISSTTGDNKLVEAVTRELGNRLGKLGYNFDYEDLVRFGNAYTNMVSWIETRNKAGAGNNTTSATSMYQMTKDFFDNQKKYILNNFHDTLPREQKDRLIKATKASDLDNDLDRPILQAMVLANVYNNLAVNNQKFDKQGPNIRSDQMAGDVISMMKDAYEAGQFDESGLFLDPVLGGNLARIWAVNFFRGTNPEAVRGAYENVNNAFNEAWGFNRDAQGNNLPWWDGKWNTPQRYQEMLGMPTVQTQQQAPQYDFDFDEGLNVAGVNRLLLNRFESANREFREGTGKNLRLTSAMRDFNKQTELWNNRATNPNGVVAQPGYSPHNAGMALDFSYNDALPLFNASETLKKKYGTMDKFFAAHGLDQGVIKNGKRIDLVHLAMTKDQEYFDTIDHDRYAKARGSWGKEDGNHWMRGVGEKPQQVQPAWDVSPQFMVENFGYPIVEYPVTDYDPIVEYPATDYDPNLIFAGNQNGYVFDYDYDEDGNQIPY